MKQYGSPLTKSFFLRDADTVARNLIGTYCFTIRDGERTGGEIIETEAYDERDPAAHCFIGEDGKRSYGSYPMLLEGGHAYIYRTNPVCLNFVCDKRNFGSAVLIRKIRATEGFELMKRRRGSDDFCSGPSKLCKAMGMALSLIIRRSQVSHSRFLTADHLLTHRKSRRKHDTKFRRTSKRAKRRPN